MFYFMISCRSITSSIFNQKTRYGFRADLMALVKRYNVYISQMKKPTLFSDCNLDVSNLLDLSLFCFAPRHMPTRTN
jgi:hypothetical protein